jgi:hypothetical protein
MNNALTLSPTVRVTSARKRGHYQSAFDDLFSAPRLHTWSC